VRTDPLHDPRIILLTESLGKPSVGEEEVRFNSPFQDRFRDPTKPDKAKHLYVNLKKGKFFDYKTSMCGSISYLYFQLGIASDSSPVPVQDLAYLRERLNGLDKVKTFVLPIADLPDWYNPVHQGSVVHMYLKSRGISDEDIGVYRIGEGILDGDHKVILPSFGPAGECQYWVARSADPKNKVRYKNPTVHRRYHVGFLYVATKYSPESIVLCEGVFSSITAGRDSVATYGKFVTNDQLHRIRQAGVKDLKISLDGDAYQEALDTAQRALRMGFTVSVVELPVDKDPADLGREQFRVLLKSAVPVTTLSLLKMRLKRV
jgi:hypothetical protein